MAIDTAEKRFSIMSFGQPFNKLRPPTGSVDAAERATLLDLYSGIALGAPSAVNELDFMRGLNRGIMHGIARGMG